MAPEASGKGDEPNCHFIKPRKVQLAQIERGSRSAMRTMRRTRATTQGCTTFFLRTSATWVELKTTELEIK